RKPLAPAACAHLAETVVSALPGTGPVDAVGFSMGAGLVLSVASRLPDRFGRIVVGGVGANLFQKGDPEPIARAVERAVAADDDPGVGRAFAVFAAGADNDPLALAACLRRPTQPLTAAQLSLVTCPVL